MAFIKQHIACDDCGSSDARSIDDSGWSHCFACETRKPANDNSPESFSKPLSATKRKNMIETTTFHAIASRGLTGASNRTYQCSSQVNGETVFNYCNEMAGGKYEIYVGSDDQKLAYELATYVFKQIGGKGNVIVQDGVPGAITAQNRHKGFMKAIEENSGIKLLTAQPADYNRLKGMQVMENLLQRFPKIDVVLAANDEQALGAVEAIDAAGRLKEIKVTGVDANYDAAQSIMAGRQYASADYAGLVQGYLATKAAIEYLNGKKVPKRIILPVAIVTKENAKEWTEPFEKRALPDWKAMLEKHAVW